MTDFRALCAELLQELKSAHDDVGLINEPRASLIDRARAALAQPEPEGPTDEEIIAFWSEHCAGDGDAGIIRLARWSRPTPQPANGEVAELVTWLRLTADEQPHTSGQGGIRLARAADLLSRLSPPQPIPVSERLPGPGDCDAEGRCWWFEPDDTYEEEGGWSLLCIRGNTVRWTHWLPAHALPVPTND